MSLIIKEGIANFQNYTYLGLFMKNKDTNLFMLNIIYGCQNNSWKCWFSKEVKWLPKSVGHPEVQEVLVFDINWNKWFEIMTKGHCWFNVNSFLMFQK
jgi:hypothetical protein